MARQYTLSENDKKRIESLLREQDLRIRNTPSRVPTEHSFSEAEDHQAPEIYIAIPRDVGGIPAIKRGDVDEPGKAMCEIYTIQKDAAGTPGIWPIEGRLLPVYNIHDVPMPDDWFLVHRHKGGYWIAENPGTSGFWAILFDKVALEITQTVGKSSDPLFVEPTCPPAILPLYRGEYSWVEAEPNPADPGEMKPLIGGRFGVAGECDGAWEVNRSNANIHVERMVVWMWRGLPEDCESGEQVSSEVKLFTSSWQANSSNYRYWFNINVPREDCANRYVITQHVLNDVI